MPHAIGVFLTRIYTNAAVPDELRDAGRIFFRIVLRILMPCLVPVYLFNFISIWNDFFLPLIVLHDQKLWPVTLGLYSLQLSSLSTNPDTVRLVVTGSLVGTILLVILFFGLQRYWRSGLTTGAIR
jgi:multiple sugar transport system permease protein